MALLLLVLATSFAQAQPQSQRTDRRIDALSGKTLLTASPADLVDRVSQRRARTIGEFQQASFLAWAAAPIVAFLWLWRSGYSARLRDLLRRRFRTRWLYRGTFGALLGLLAGLTQAPFAFAVHRVASNAGMTTQSSGAWFLDELLRLATIALVSAFLVATALELVDRTRLWYLAMIPLLYLTVLVAVAIEPVLLSPLATPHLPAPAAIVAEGDALAQTLGVRPVPIEIVASSGRTNALNARASGLGTFDRILLGNLTVARLSEGERRFVIARLYVHIREHAALVLALAGTTLFIFAAALAVLISDRIGFRRDDDPLSRLALVGTFLGLAVLVLFPGYNALERRIESRADRLALRATGDPASAVRVFVRRADDDLIALCGHRTTRWYFESRGPLGTRIAEARGTQDPCSR